MGGREEKGLSKGKVGREVWKLSESRGDSKGSKGLVTVITHVERTIVLGKLFLDLDVELLLLGLLVDEVGDGEGLLPGLV